MTMLILLLCQRSKQLRGNTFFANFHQYLRETVFVYSYGAQVESFNQKKSKISWHFPSNMFDIYFHTGHWTTVLYIQYAGQLVCFMSYSCPCVCGTACQQYSHKQMYYACETSVLLDSRQPYLFICKQRFFGTHDTFFAFVRNNFLITITKNSLLVSSPKMCLLSLCSMSYETCEF